MSRYRHRVTVYILFFTYCVYILLAYFQNVSVLCNNFILFDYKRIFNKPIVHPPIKCDVWYYLNLVSVSLDCIKYLYGPRTVDCVSICVSKIAVSSKWRMTKNGREWERDCRVIIFLQMKLLIKQRLNTVFFLHRKITVEVIFQWTPFLNK